MAVTDNRKYTKAFVYNHLEGVKGKTLGEVDKSHQFARTINSERITGIAGEDKDPRLVFELEFLESLPQYVHIDLNIFRTYRDTLLGRIIGDMI